LLSTAERTHPADAPSTKALEQKHEQATDVEGLLRRLRSLPPEDPRRADIEAELVELHKPVLHQIARRYSLRGEPTEDLLQTAMVGLMKAIHGFDVTRGKPFMSYLLPVATGEVKRHFRDNTWALRVPRRHQENRSALNRFTVEFSQRHGRSPTVDEIAQELDMPSEEVLELIAASSAYSALSLDAPYGEGEDAAPLADSLGSPDAMLEHVVDHECLKSAITGLSDRERTILLLRFFHEKTQTDIARHLGCSQMHVSRLLSRTLTRLRESIMSEN
jgi:RNA polymerase sigma-B factor